VRFKPEYLIIQHLCNPMGAALKEFYYIALLDNGGWCPTRLEGFFTVMLKFV